MGNGEQHQIYDGQGNALQPNNNERDFTAHSEKHSAPQEPGLATLSSSGLHWKTGYSGHVTYSIMRTETTPTYTAAKTTTISLQQRSPHKKCKSLKAAMNSIRWTKK